MSRHELQKRVADITTVIYFLKGARDSGDMYNSYTAADALSAACRLTGVDEAAFLLKAEGFLP